MTTFYKTYIVLLTIGLMATGTASARSELHTQDPTISFTNWNPVETKISILRGPVKDNASKSLLNLPMDDQDTGNDVRILLAHNQQHVC